MDIENAQYDSSATADVVGLTGLFRGTTATVHLGQSLVVGRSRTCGMSVARAEECLRLSKADLESHKSYRKISRQHVKICLSGQDRLEVEDLSTNGTVVNGFRVDRLVIEQFASANKKVVIEFGHGERLEVTAGGPAAERSSEALTEQRELPSYDPNDHPSGIERMPVL